MSIAAQMRARNLTGRILDACADHYEVPRRRMRARRRYPADVEARSVAAYLIRRRYAPGMSFPEIARLLGGVHHTTVMAAVERVERMLESDRYLAAMIDSICIEVEGGEVAA